MSFLASVKVGHVDSNRKLLIAGESGVGKSTAACSGEGVVAIDPCGGTDRIDVARLSAPKGAWTWPMLIEAGNELCEQDHDYSRLVIDELGHWENLSWRYLCQQHGKENIESWGYGQGYKLALDEWGRLLAKLERLREKMEIVLVVHSHAKPYRNPEGPDYDRMVPNLNTALSAKLRGWCDTVLFARFLDTTAKKDTGRSIGITGARVFETTHSATWDAKNRDGLPARLPLDWDTYQEAVDRGSPGTPEELAADIEALLGKLDKAKERYVKAKMKQAGEDCTKLKMVLNYAQTHASTETEGESNDHSR